MSMLIRRPCGRERYLFRPIRCLCRLLGWLLRPSECLWGLLDACLFRSMEYLLMPLWCLWETFDAFGQGLNRPSWMPEGYVCGYMYGLNMRPRCMRRYNIGLKLNMHNICLNSHCRCLNRYRGPKAILMAWICVTWAWTSIQNPEFQRPEKASQGPNRQPKGENIPPEENIRNADIVTMVCGCTTDKCSGCAKTTNFGCLQNC